MPKLEPAGHNPDDMTRPDIEFRNADRDAWTTAVLGGYHTADVTVIGAPIRYTRDVIGSPDTTSPRYWQCAMKEKDTKHTTATMKCLPVAISVYGAICPTAIRWIEWCHEHAAVGPGNKPKLRTLIIDIVTTIWKYNSYMYGESFSRLPDNSLDMMPRP